MKQNKKMLLVLVVLLLVLGAVCIALSLGSGDEEGEATEGTALTVVRTTAPEDITAFTLNGTESTLDFALCEDGWVYNGDVNFPLNPDYVNSALTTLSEITALRVIEGGTADLASYGLDEPQMSLSFTAADTVEILIGDYNSFTGYHYMCESGGEDVFLIDTALVDLCSGEESDAIVLDTLPDTLADAAVNTVTLSGAAGEQAYTEESEEFESLSGEVQAIELADYADYYLTEEEYAEWGLDSPTAVRLDYSAEKTTAKDDGSEVSATVAYEYTYTFGGVDDTYVYFTVEDSTILYRMEKADLPTLCALLDS